MPRLIYTALFYLLSPLYFLRLFWRGLSNKDYLYRWNERLGFSDSRPSEDLPVIWLHAVSVGEVNASIPLLRALISDFPNSEYIVTTTTPTGSAILLDKMGTKVRHQYMPVDLPLCLDKFLNTWKPKALIILETEIWPNLISHCKNRGIFTALVNARLSEKSKNKYSQPLVKSLVTSTIEGIDLILAQFQSDLLRFEELSKGINISLCGNLKFDQEVPEEIDSIISTIKADWSIEGKERPVLIAASTHELEETIILEAFHGIKDVLSDALLVLVPRHPERFKKILNLIKDEGFVVAQRSKQEDVTKDTQVLLGDTMGELDFLYSVADVAFVGGSLIDHGGQNLLEPAAIGLPITSGPSLRNFQEVATQLEDAGGLTIVNSSNELIKTFINFIEQEGRKGESGKASKEVFLKNRGSLEKIRGKLVPVLNKIL
ncbi:lipid IV(A) 3-deoxy-D-manno-octulosonic acid transferase [Gammaproteobacteria bacterium]|nr:lipid IV(A) 3-deoxy-D-manno-octulosonic acid transferase [Gammaproteobacteria bacterium]